MFRDPRATVTVDDFPSYDDAIHYARDELKVLDDDFKQMGFVMTHIWMDNSLSITFTSRAVERGVSLPTPFPNAHMSYLNGVTTLSFPAPEETRADKVIMLVDDNGCNLKILDYFFRKRGCQTILCDNGQVALDTYTQRHAEVSGIVMDCDMPVMDGCEATEKIREFETAHHLEPVYITALTGSPMYQSVQVLRSGMNQYLTKPMKVQELQRFIDTL